MELEFQNYPKFTPEMKKTHKILIPNMAPVQFRILAAVMRQAGYTCELLENCGSQVSELGLKYVHNDTCYPALLVIGQFLDALGSGKYDLDHTALIITQTGGGCRASNYIHLLRKALVKAGYGQVPVVSLNFSGLEKDSGFPMTLPLMRKLLACIYYGDLLVALKAQTEPYETHKGDAAALQEKWLDTICGWVMEDKGWSGREIKAAMPKIAAEFAAIPVHRVPKVKVGVVGEIYVKYSPLGNNDLEKFLASQDCEVNLPGLMGFVQYCAYNPSETARLYGGTFLEKHVSSVILDYIEGMEKVMIRVLKDNGFHAPLPFRELVKLTEEAFHWKRTTAHNVLRRLCDKGLFRNDNGTVTSLISRDEFYAMQSRQFVEDTFEGSLPAFLAAFTKDRALTAEEAAKIRKMIDEAEGGKE